MNSPKDTTNKFIAVETYTAVVSPDVTFSVGISRLTEEEKRELEKDLIKLGKDNSFICNVIETVH